MASRPYAHTEAEDVSSLGCESRRSLRLRSASRARDAEIELRAPDAEGDAESAGEAALIHLEWLGVPGLEAEGQSAVARAQTDRNRAAADRRSGYVRADSIIPRVERP